MVKLRRLKREDAQGMLEWMHDPEIQKCFRNHMAGKNRDEVLDFIEKADLEVKEGGSLHYAVSDRTDQYLGTISLKNFDMLSRNAEYAISLRRVAQERVSL